MRYSVVGFALLLTGAITWPLSAQARAQVDHPVLVAYTVRLPAASLATAPRALPSVLPRRTYRTEGSWLGLGVGVGLAVLIYSSCDSCTGTEKGLYSTSAAAGTTLAGTLIGKQFHK